MSNINLKKWRQRIGFNEFDAAARLGLSIVQYQLYENNDEEIPKYIELASFAIELGEILVDRASKQNPKFGNLGQSWAYARAHFLRLLFNERKLIFSVNLNKSHSLYLGGNHEE